jgi:hypothetical protein
MKPSEFMQISDNYLTKWFWFCAGVIILSKLLLIGKNEIVAMPYDSLEYIRQVAYGINSIGSTPKGYPLWLWITNFFGAPQRLVIELLYLSSSLMLAHSISRVASGKMGLFVLLFLVFSPNSFFLFDKALSDGFYMCLTLAGVALSVSIIYAQHGSRDYWIKTITLGLTLGLMLITRNEEPLIVAWVVWLILMLWRFVWNQEKLTLAGKVKSALSFIGTIAVVAYGLVGAVLLMHYLTNGVAAGSLATLPGHVELLKNLARIDTQEESVRFVPISKKARGMAYDVSPALRELKLIIESPENPYQVASRQHHLPEGEIGAGWIWHVFNNAAFSKIGSQGVRGVNAYYGKINHELETAFSHGTLKKTFVVHPLFGNNLFVGVDYFPSSLLRVVGMSLSADRFQPDMGTESGLFDRICLRRTTLADSITRQPIQGWAILDKPGSIRVESVQIETEYGQGGVKESSLTIATEMQRYDVVEGYKKAEGRIPAVFGFRAELGAVRGELKKIIYVLSDGRKIGVEAPLKKGVSSVGVGDSNFMIIQGFDLTGDVMTSSRRGMGFKIQNTIIYISEWIAVKTMIGILVIGGLLFSVVQIIRVVPASIPRHLLLVIFISGIVIFRIGFYTLIDAAAWSIDLRYLAPANALLLVLFALVLAGVSRWVWRGLVTFVHRRLSL